MICPCISLLGLHLSGGASIGDMARETLIRSHLSVSLPRVSV